jgi:single-strand DNA-binding protein
MSSVEVRQIGHVAVAPRVQTIAVKGRSQTKAVLIVISNNRWLDDEGQRQERATSISWTLWGKAAVNAGGQLGIGSKVGISGTLESRRYRNKEGKDVYTFDFTARSIDYLESKADAEARRDRRAAPPVKQPARAPGNTSTKTSPSRAPAKEA